MYDSEIYFIFNYLLFVLSVTDNFLPYKYPNNNLFLTIRISQ